MVIFSKAKNVKNIKLSQKFVSFANENSWNV